MPIHRHLPLQPAVLPTGWYVILLVDKRCQAGERKIWRAQVQLLLHLALRLAPASDSGALAPVDAQAEFEFLDDHLGQWKIGVERHCASPDVIRKFSDAVRAQRPFGFRDLLGNGHLVLDGALSHDRADVRLHGAGRVFVREPGESPGGEAGNVRG